jgi:hypothetical protein
VSANAAAGGGVTGTDHRVTLFDLSCNGAGLDLRTIKVLTYGTTVIHCEADGSRWGARLAAPGAQSRHSDVEPDALERRQRDR